MTLERAVLLDEESIEQFEAGSLTAAEESCRAALALFEMIDGPVHPDCANLRQRLSAIFDAQSRYREAEEFAARAVTIMDEVALLATGPEIELIQVECLRRWGAALRQLGQYREAEPVLRQAVKLAELSRDLVLIVGALNDLGMWCKYSGNFAEGGPTYQRALAIALELYGEEHLTVATLYHNIGGLEHARGNFQAGEAPARRACEIRRALLGLDNPETLADECAYAGVLDGLGRYAESRPIYERALSIFERHYGPEHFEVAATLHNLSAVDFAEGEVAMAQRRAASALTIKLKLFGSEHPECLLTARHLANVSSCGRSGPSIPRGYLARS
jgi:tetratricopeptide (TPR) repeat protein